MKILKLLPISLIIMCLASCKTDESDRLRAKLPSINWDQRVYQDELPDSLEYASSYLSVYSSIYSNTESEKLLLGSTISLRNPNEKDTVYITRAEYFNTEGRSLRNYVKKTVFILPMETLEIVIRKLDKEGGTGANFIFDWAMQSNSREPIFEGVMISASGNRGLSFVTQAHRLRK